MIPENRSVRAMLFLMAGVALPCLLSGVLIVEQVSTHRDKGVWGIFLGTWFALHVGLVAATLYGYPRLRRMKRQGVGSYVRTRRICGSVLIGLCVLYCATVVALVVLW